MKKLTRRTFGRWIGAFAATAAGKSLFPKPALGGGVSGAPGGEADDECAQAGINAISDKLAF